MVQKTDAERIKRMQILSDTLEAQRKKIKDASIAATSEMRDAWVADRNEVDSISAQTHAAERAKR